MKATLISNENNEGKFTMEFSADELEKAVVGVYQREKKNFYIMPNDIIYVDMSSKKFWALNNFSEFVGIVTSSLTFLITVISLR